MFDKFFTFFVDTLIVAFLPLVHFYHAICSDMFLNVSYEEAVGIEKVANELLVPYQFVFSGRSAHIDETGRWHFSQRFSTEENFWPKVTLSIGALPASFVLGGAAKALAFLSPEVRERYTAMSRFYSPGAVVSHLDNYLSLGLPIDDPKNAPLFKHQGYLRKEGSENYLAEEKKLFQEIIHRLNEANVVWWVDCGTCMGAYRYGGIIPWDEDIDIALLLPDFDNAFCALSTLDKTRYIVQDWSGRDRPKTYIKVFLKRSSVLIDLYFFDIDPKKKELNYILSLENHTFLPKWWHIRESRFKVPTPFDLVFPLKKGEFDGIEVFLPNDPEKYLQLRYGDNLAPAKIYNPMTKEYEKDLSHPYWQRAYVH